jgi:integral membrane protein (TIGR00529 family)
MTFIENIPAVIRILVAFVVILAAIRAKIGLGNAFAGGAFLLGLLFGLDLPAIFISAFSSLIHPKTLSLSVVVTLILVLSHSMESAGQMERLLEKFRGLVQNPAVNMIIFPALIGLLPMPGGAIFSAPMVKTLGNRYALTGAQLSFVNYWFRHIWEYWWPLYPGVLLATGIAGLDLWLFVLLLFPMTIVALTAGFSSLKGVFKKTSTAESREGRRTRIRPFIQELIPVLIVIVLGLGLGTLLTPFFKNHGLTIAKESGLILALIIATYRVWRQNDMSVSDRWKILFRPDLYRMFYMVSAILIFQGILKDSRAVVAVSLELKAWHFPIVPICIILPCLVGFVGGITIAFVGTAFPILISLIQSLGQADLMLPYMMLAMTSGFMGVLLSPLHLCLLLSNAYFHTSFLKVYRHLWIPCTALLGASLCYFWILKKIFTI